MTRTTETELVCAGVEGPAVPYSRVFSPQEREEWERQNITALPKVDLKALRALAARRKGGAA